MTDAMRVAKFMAQAGLCSRRDAEKWILAGRVQVNGEKLRSPQVNVTPDDRVEVDEQRVSLNQTPRLWLYHKPVGLVTTHKDPEGRKTVFQELPAALPRVISVGRLDLFSEGLLLLTNSGTLARILEHPSSQLERLYEVCVEGTVTSEKQRRINEGLTIEGVAYNKVKVEVGKTSKYKTWLVFTLQEGKNREIRRIAAFMGWSISYLCRTSYGPFRLGSLKPREVEEVPYPLFKKFLDAPDHRR